MAAGRRSGRVSALDPACDGEQGGDPCQRVRQSRKMLNPFSGMRRGGGERRLSQSRDHRARGEDRQTIAPETLHGATEPPVDHPRQAGGDGDEVSERREMGQARQPEILLGDVEVGGSCGPEPRRKAGAARRSQCRHDERGDAQPDQPGRRARRPVAPDDGADQPDSEGELPGEGIEEPAAGLGPVRKVKAEAARGGIKSGKRRIVIGLLADTDGRPLNSEVFKGNTPDVKTFSSQVNKAAATPFRGAERVTFVGDRGMMKTPQRAEIASRGLSLHHRHRQSADRRPDRSRFEMDLFEDTLAEVEGLDGERYVVRRNPARAEELAASEPTS